MPSSSTGDTLQECILAEHAANAAAQIGYFLDVLSCRLPDRLRQRLSYCMDSHIPHFFAALLDRPEYNVTRTRQHNDTLHSLYRIHPTACQLLDALASTLLGSDMVLRHVGRYKEANAALALAGKVQRFLSDVVEVEEQRNRDLEERLAGIEFGHD